VNLTGALHPGVLARRDPDVLKVIASRATGYLPGVHGGLKSLAVLIAPHLQHGNEGGVASRFPFG